MADPKVLLLDEPSEGLAPRLVESLVEQLKWVRDTGLTMLLAEQHAGLVEELASRAYTLERGAGCQASLDRCAIYRRIRRGDSKGDAG